MYILLETMVQIGILVDKNYNFENHTLNWNPSWQLLQLQETYFKLES